MRFSFLFLALAFVLTGCPRPLDENGERRKDVEAREAAREQATREQASGARGIEVVADSVREDDEARRLSARIGYPVLVGDAPALEAVNRAFRGMVTGFVRDMAPEEPLAPDAGDWERYEFSGGFEVDYVSESYVSVLQSMWAYTGGAHGNTSFAPQTYDLRTGQPLAFSDVYATDQAALDVLREAAVAFLAQDLKRRTDNPEATPEEHLWLDEFTATPEAFEERWTMGSDSLILHFAPYAVSAYVYGSWRVPVAYTDLAGHLGPVTAQMYQSTSRSRGHLNE